MIAKKLATLLQLATIFIGYSSCQDVFNINTKKVVASTSDKFLSLTFDPAVLMTGDVLASSTEQSTNMAKGLAPGYVRLAGPRSNAFTFERTLFPQSGNEEPNFTFSEAHWVLVQEWAQRAGLDVVACLTPQRIENEDQVAAWDPRNSLDLISFSDHMGYNISWQLGYECQTRCDISGFDLGKDVARLKNMLGAFPRYSNSLIAGPDVVSFRGKQQQQFIQDYLNAAGNALSVITWHPDFAGISLDADGVALQTDTLAADKDLLYKAMGRTVAKKPLWIAESKPEECKRQFLGAMVWARRLGSAARLGVQVIMRQPDALNILQPTPDYWVSLLHKTLVGREVLDAKFNSSNKTHVHFYCQCTKPSSKYDRGAVTIFGLNLTPNKVSVTLKGLKIKALHKYILMPGYDSENRMFSETVLLNNEPLNLVDGKALPDINPAVTMIGKNMAVKLPSGGIGFWVVPGARVKSCMGHDEEAGDKTLLRKLTKRLEESEAVDENVGHEVEEDRNSEVESETEDIKSLLKSKIKKRKLRHSDEVEDEERRFKRLDAKREFEKLDKFLRRNSNNDDKKLSHFKARMGLTTIDDGSAEEKKDDDSSEEEKGLMRLKKDKTNSVEDMNAKIEGYKKKLIQYEARKKNQERNFANKHEHFEPIEATSSKSKDQPDEDSLTSVDSQKAIEALALISRVEGAMRRYGASGEKTKYEVAPSNGKSFDTQASDTGEELLIEELEKQDKMKRMIDPESLNTFLQYLVSNSEQSKVKKRNIDGDSEPAKVEKARRKRDLEKLLGDDPLGLRKEGLFKKRLRNDDVKERRFERRNRRKDKDEIGLKKDFAVTRFDHRLTDSNENNFFGFPKMKPLENFPQGDVFFSEGSSSEEKDVDYDYVKDDDEAEKTRKQKQKKRRMSNTRKEDRQVVDETWVEEPNSKLYQAPNEFFEKVNLEPVTINTQWKNYDELWEPESLQHKELKENGKKIQQENDAVDDIVVPRDRPDDNEDKRVKETTVKKLINYYDNADVLRDEQTFGQDKPQVKEKRNKSRFRAEAPAQSKAKIGSISKPEQTADKNTKRILDLDNYEDSDDLGSTQFVSSKAEDSSENIYNDNDDDDDDGVIVSELRTKVRPRRSTDNMDDMLNEEMILEDAGNFKDCKCRVIRRTGKLRCKNCKRISRRQRDVADANAGEAANYFIATPEPMTVDQQHVEEKERPTEDLPVNVNDEEKSSKDETDQVKEILQSNQQTSAASETTNVEEETTGAADSEISSTSEVQPLINTESGDLNTAIDDPANSMAASSGPAVIPIDDVSPSPFGGENKQFEDNNVPTSLPVIQPSDSTQETKTTSDTAVGLQGVSDLDEGRVEVEKSNDDTVGSQQLVENNDSGNSGATDLNSEIQTLDQGDPIKPDEEPEDGEKAGGINEKVNGNGDEEIHPKRQTDTEFTAESESGTRISLGTGIVEESSGKSGGPIKPKNKLEMKLKSGLKSDLSKSKLIMNTEALSALIKENESKKAEMMKALESSAKLKSIDNAKYLEYQKKRSEKLAILKDKLKERKAKILQQYRQELLDALSKCDNEVEKTLKRREIWDNFTQEDEYQDFADKDKLAYLMMNRPVNYENTEEQNNAERKTEDERYHPEIAHVQPLRPPRERKTAETEPRRMFYEPQGMEYVDVRQLPSSQESIFDPSSVEDAYYAIADSMENPKVFHKKQFDVYRNGGQPVGSGQHDVASDFYLDDKTAKEVQRQEKIMPRRNSEDGQVAGEENVREVDKEVVGAKQGDGRMLQRFQHYPRYEYLPRHLLPIYAVDRSPIYEGREPMAHAYYDEDLDQEYGTLSYYDDEYPAREENALYESYDREAWRPRFIVPGTEGHRRISYYSENFRPMTRGREQLLMHRRMVENPTTETKYEDGNVNPEKLTTPKRFAFDVNARDDQGEFYGDKTTFQDGFGILHRLEPPCSGGRCGNQASVSPQGEAQRYIEYPSEEFELPNSRITLPSRHSEKLLSRSGRHLIPEEKQAVNEPAYKIGSLDPWHDPTVRKEREVKGKKANYICMKEDSQEDSQEDEKRLFKLVRNSDYYAAVPITELATSPEGLVPERQTKIHRRVIERDGKVRNKRRKYSTYDFTNEDASYYPLNGDATNGKRQYFDRQQFAKQRNENLAKSQDETDYREIGDEINNVETTARLSPEEYELLMLIPVKKHANKRHRRDLLNNEINRSESYEDTMNKQWNDLLGVKWNDENLLDQEIDDKDDPLQLQNLGRIIVNLGSPNREKISVVTKVNGEPDGIYHESYSKEKIMKKVESLDEKEEQLMTSTSGTSNTPTFLDIAIPKLENTINDKLDKVGNLTESLEDFINKFNDTFNTTTEIKSNKTASETPIDNPNDKQNFFHTVLKKVKNFFKFLSGISLVFSRY